MLKFLNQLLCNHDFIHKFYNKDYYDHEHWQECTKCGKQKG